MIVCAALAIGLVLTGCPTEDDDSGGGGGNADGMGSITITGIKSGLNGAKIVHSTVSGAHQTLNAFTIAGGQMSGSSLDNTGSATISSGSVTIPVRGIEGGTSYRFTDGIYVVQLTISNADDPADDRQYNLTANFSGGKSTVAANTSNGLGINP